MTLHFRDRRGAALLRYRNRAAITDCLSVNRSYPILGSSSNDVFEWSTSTGSRLFALFGREFLQILGQIVSFRVRTLSHTNLVASRHIKGEKGSLPVEARRSKTSLLEFPIVNIA